MNRLLLGILLLALLLLPGVVLMEGTDELTLNVETDRDAVAINEGESITGSWVASGGVGPYAYSYTWTINGDITPVKSEWSTGLQTDTLIPTYGKYGRLEVSAEDSGGMTGWGAVDFAITGDESGRLALSGRTDQESYSVGSQVNASWAAEGGAEPYNYSCSVHVFYDFDGEKYEEELDVSLNTDRAISFVPLFGERGTVSVIVTDAEGAWASLDLQFGITGSVQSAPPYVTLTMQDNFVKVGEAA
ncbi:MAG: hypothetical protein AB9880_01760 [Christensenellales bacterium]